TASPSIASPPSGTTTATRTAPAAPWPRRSPHTWPWATTYRSRWRRPRSTSRARSRAASRSAPASAPWTTAGAGADPYVRPHKSRYGPTRAGAYPYGPIRAGAGSYGPLRSEKPATPGGVRALPCDAVQRVTLPALMQEVQTLSLFEVPLTTARTDWMLGFQRRRVRRWEWDTLLPKVGPLRQTSQTEATVSLLITVDVVALSADAVRAEGMPGQPASQARISDRHGCVRTDHWDRTRHNDILL